MLEESIRHIVEDDLSTCVARAWMRINDYFQAQVEQSTGEGDAQTVKRLLDEQYWFNLEFRQAGDSLSAAEVVQRWNAKLSL